MNIFFLSFDPEIAAKWHCDKHVVKMILESTQLLWTAHHVLATASASDAATRKAEIPLRPYKPTHKNHPCAKWVRESLANYMWLCDLADALVEEYHWRFCAADAPTQKHHACEPHLKWLRANPPRALLAAGMPRSLTPPAQAMPDEFRCDVAPEAYRSYYREEKLVLMEYSRREKPDWIFD